MIFDRFFSILFFLNVFFIVARSEVENLESAEIKKDYVLELTDDTFDEAIDGNENILVEFYAPWCGHCQALVPEYARAAETLSDEGIVLAKIDATTNEKSASGYEVTGYPTLIYFKNGGKFLFDGERSAAGIVEWLRERSADNWKPRPSSVLQLTNDNFTEIIKKSELILVEFYAPWCGHCRRMEPEYDKASGVLSPLGILLAKVDTVAEESLKSMFHIQGYPTLKIFRKGREFEYKGPRDAEGIVRYMKNEATPATKFIEEMKKLENIINNNKEVATVVGFFENDQMNLFLEYQAATNELRGQHSFLHTFDKKIADHYKVKSFPSIVVLKPEYFQSKYEKSRHEYLQEDAKSSEIVAFVQKSVLPFVGHRTKQNMPILYSKRPLVVVYYDVNFSLAHRKATQLIRNEVVEVAKSHPEITFCISGEEEYQDELKDLGLDDSGEDVNVGFYTETTLKYPLSPEDGFNAKILSQFIASVLKGKIQPYFKSQPIPKRNDEAVKIVVGKTFNEMVEQNDKNVLIEFYAPWCGHCKSLEKVYAQLAKKLKDHKWEVLVAKMDATANDVPPPFEVSGFPTIYFVPAKDKRNPILFSVQDRSLNTLYEFVINQISGQQGGKDEL